MVEVDELMGEIQALKGNRSTWGRYEACLATCRRHLEKSLEELLLGSGIGFEDFRLKAAS